MLSVSLTNFVVIRIALILNGSAMGSRTASMARMNHLNFAIKMHQANLARQVQRGVYLVRRTPIAKPKMA